jgi:hypothetical protein
MKSYMSHALALLSVACGPVFGESVATDELSSVHARAAMGQITAGIVVGPDLKAEAPDFAVQAEALVREQLRYSVGFLNGRKGAPSLQRTKITSVTRVGAAGPGLAQYKYSAELSLILGHSPENDAAKELEMLLPAQVDTAFLTGFLARYKVDCVSNLRDKPTLETFFYYYRPEAFFCPITQSKKPLDTASVQHVKLALESQPEGPTTYPEYDAIWNDGKLVYTGVFMQVDGAFGDIGRESYGSTVRELTETFGVPTIEVPKGMTAKDLANQVRAVNVQPSELALRFASPKGPVEVHLYLLAKLTEPEVSVPDFANRYGASVENSDLVAFSGHASYGLDVERFSKLGRFKSGQYQMFLLNACDSFAYEAPVLREAHLAINKAAAAPASFFDLVVNAMPAPAHEIPGVTMSFVRAFAEGKQSYKEILATINEEQRAVVLYDEDNLWKPKK